ncbi:MAG: hypothetical protein ABI142_06275, partial [Bryocella sp.]
LGENRMNYRARSSDDPDLVTGDFNQAYRNPLSSVLADYVYNSLLTGRPYFLQMMDDIKIAELFLHSREAHPQPVTIAASGSAYGLAARFQELEPSVKLLQPKSAPTLDWNSLVMKRQEQWPIAFLMPSGAYVK